MSDTVSISALFLELDTLLDTRFSTIIEMGEETVSKVLKNNYHGRFIDKFEGIDNDLFSSIYNNRDKRILKNTLVTPITFIINEFVTKTNKQNISSPIFLKPKIILNTYPYVLEESEVEVFIKILIQITNNQADIEIVNLNYQNMTPSYLNDEVSIMILYNYNQWLEEQVVLDNFKNKACPSITLFAPAIVFTESIEDIPIKKAFKAVEIMTEPFISLKLLPVEYFSFVKK